MDNILVQKYQLIERLSTGPHTRCRAVSVMKTPPMRNCAGTRAWPRHGRTPTTTRTNTVARPAQWQAPTPGPATHRGPPASTPAQRTRHRAPNDPSVQVPPPSSSPRRRRLHGHGPTRSRPATAGPQSATGPHPMPVRRTAGNAPQLRHPRQPGSTCPSGTRHPGPSPLTRKERFPKPGHS